MVVTCENHEWTHWDCRACVAAYRRARRRRGQDLPVRVGRKVTTERALGRTR